MESAMDGMADLARRLADHEITLGQWQQTMRDEIRAEVLRQYLLGRGGKSQMAPADRGSVGGVVADQYRYLDGFAARIAAGEHTEAQIAAISRMYIRSAREGYERANMRAHGVLKLPAYPGDGSTSCLTNCLCRWVIQRKESRVEATWALSDAEHCETCVQRSVDWAPYVVPLSDLAA